MVPFLKRFRQEHSGATAIEYGLIAAIMATAIIASVPLLKQPLIDTFTYITSNLNI